MTTTESITPRAIALSDEATQHLTSATLKDNAGLQGRGLIIANPNLQPSFGCGQSLSRP